VGAAAAGQSRRHHARAAGRDGGAQQPRGKEAAANLKAWRTSVSMDKFKALRKMYNDAGVSIYAWKQLSPTMSDEEFEYVFNVAEALGCTHTTLGLPAGENSDAQLKRIGDFAMKKKIYAAYHTHAQGGMADLRQGVRDLEGEHGNVDFGHWVAAGNVGGTPMDFLNKYHDRDLELPSEGSDDAGALRAQPAVGHRRDADQGNPPARARQEVEDPRLGRARIRLPEGSDPVQETRKCVEYCRAALNAPKTTASR
jgi:hypothetical protein